jgi:predicted nucleic acid-binding protein
VRLNLQVLNEVTNVVLRKHWFDSPLQVYAIIDELANMGAEALGWGDVEVARLLHATQRYSWWDCLLLASALELGRTHFLSEDLQDGQVIEDGGGKALTILSPFAHSPEQFFSSR